MSIAQLIDADDRIDADLACAGCGYNVRSLPRDGRCPECGHSVDDSVRAGWLAFAPRGWLERTARAVEQLLAACVALIGGWILVALAYVAALTLTRRGLLPAGAPRITLMLAYAALLIAFLAPLLRGLAGLSAPEPAPSARERGRWVRAALRCMMVLVPVPLLLGWSELLAEFVPGFHFSAARRMAEIGGHGAAAISIIVPALVLLRLRQLIRRTRERRLHRGLLIALWLVIAAVGLVGAGRVVASPQTVGGLLTPAAARRLATSPYSGGVRLNMITPQTFGTPAAPGGATLRARIAGWSVASGRWLGVVAVVYGLALLVRVRSVLLRTAEFASPDDQRAPMQPAAEAT
ncbi:MAG: hypothetical protein D6744_03530 [Planctomycetota bacterium]|nr:MAG: hypothetical protein D6744_03530 [Planctomycetota bacterium]